jgi:uncharacterized membrane protein
MHAGIAADAPPSGLRRRKPAMPSLRVLAETASTVVEIAGLAIILLGMALALVHFARSASIAFRTRYRQLRQDVGRAILLGLEFLVAGDIIHTVAVRPTLDEVLVLGLIVLVRTVLSMALEVELTGRLPWRAAEAGSGQVPP